METETNQSENGNDGPVKRNQTWEANHVLITKAMAKLVYKWERWPTKAEIMEETGLGKTTVYKHLEEFGQEELLLEELAQLKCMSSKIMAKLCELAMGGDAKAMRMSFELMGLLRRGGGARGLEKR